MFSAATYGETLHSQQKKKKKKKGLGADCGSEHELFIAKFMLKLKKVGKTTRSFRYDRMKSLMTIEWK